MFYEILNVTLTYYFCFVTGELVNNCLKNHTQEILLQTLSGRPDQLSAEELSELQPVQPGGQAGPEVNLPRAGEQQRVGQVGGANSDI